MRWILGSGKEITVDNSQLEARREYIRHVTGADVSAWKYINIDGQISREFLCCASNDGVDGTFITAHIGGVYKICSLHQVCRGKLVIANTCIWERFSHKILLLNMMSINTAVELWFAKQNTLLDSDHILRQSTTLNNVGQFRFQTSLSERELFKKRDRGLMEAIRESFERVSPIILLGD